jgi:hypothetical protein
VAGQRRARRPPLDRREHRVADDEPQPAGLTGAAGDDHVDVRARRGGRRGTGRDHRTAGGEQRGGEQDADASPAAGKGKAHVDHLCFG